MANLVSFLGSTLRSTVQYISHTLMREHVGRIAAMRLLLDHADESSNSCVLLFDDAAVAKTAASKLGDALLLYDDAQARRLMDFELDARMTIPTARLSCSEASAIAAIQARTATRTYIYVRT